MTHPKPLPPAAYLRQLFGYNAETGQLIWAIARKGCAKGSVAGHKNKSMGYMQLTIDRKAYLMHRIIWKLVTGEDPTEP